MTPAPSLATIPLWRLAAGLTDYRRLYCDPEPEACSQSGLSTDLDSDLNTWTRPDSGMSEVVHYVWEHRISAAMTRDSARGQAAAAGPAAAHEGRCRRPEVPLRAVRGAALRQQRLPGGGALPLFTLLAEMRDKAEQAGTDRRVSGTLPLRLTTRVPLQKQLASTF